MVEQLRLHDGRWNVVVSPAHGGSLALCEFDGIPVLIPAARLERLGRAAISCCYFPMIPFVNRIENARFTFAGASVQLSENIAGTPHAIHGHGWQTAWRVLRSNATACSMSYRHEANADWPWSYEGTQSFEVLGDTLRIALAIRNLATTPMPVSQPVRGVRLVSLSNQSPS